MPRPKEWPKKACLGRTKDNKFVYLDTSGTAEELCAEMDAKNIVARKLYIDPTVPQKTDVPFAVASVLTKLARQRKPKDKSPATPPPADPPKKDGVWKCNNCDERFDLPVGTTKEKCPKCGSVNIEIVDD